MGRMSLISVNAEVALSVQTKSFLSGPVFNSECSGERT